MQDSLGAHAAAGRWVHGHFALVARLITEGDTAEEALDNVRDALAAVVEAYQDTGHSLPGSLMQDTGNGPVWLETLVATP